MIFPFQLPAARLIDGAVGTLRRRSPNVVKRFIKSSKMILTWGCARADLRRHAPADAFTRPPSAAYYQTRAWRLPPQPSSGPVQINSCPSRVMNGNARAEQIDSASPPRPDIVGRHRPVPNRANSGNWPPIKSLRLDASGANDLSPLLGMFTNELAELGRRARKRLQP